jgi:hypothetical protein
VVVTAHEHGFGIEPQFIIRATDPDMLVEPIRKAFNEVESDAFRMVRAP